MIESPGRIDMSDSDYTTDDLTLILHHEDGSLTTRTHDNLVVVSYSVRLLSEGGTSQSSDIKPYTCVAGPELSPEFFPDIVSYMVVNHHGIQVKDVPEPNKSDIKKIFQRFGESPTIKAELFSANSGIDRLIQHSSADLRGAYAKLPWHQRWNADTAARKKRGEM